MKLSYIKKKNYHLAIKDKKESHIKNLSQNSPSSEEMFYSIISKMNLNDADERKTKDEVWEMLRNEM